MKELHTTKPLVIGIIGLPGAGKTHFAREFSSMFGAPAIEAELLSRTIFAGRATTREDEEGLARAYWALASEFFKMNRTFILDGHLHTYANRSEVRALAKNAGYDVLWVWVQTSEAVARDRATRVKRNPANTILTAQQFTQATKSFQPPRASETHVVTSGQRTFSSQVRPILARLAEAHESKLQTPRPTERPSDQPDRPQRRNIFIR